MLRLNLLALFGVLSSVTWALPVLSEPYTIHHNETWKRSPGGSKSVIIQMFEWSWDSVANECTSFIGPAGYGFVQVSPPAEHIQGSQWWTDYQPVSYNLNSKRGNRSQFQNMISKCHGAGVGVIVDTIWNHMAGIEGGTGVGGSSFNHYNYPGIYQTQDFHHCGLTSGDDIQNYSDAKQVQTCELVNLSDLATDTDYVRGRLAAYGNDLLSLGADGLRLDAAKHIASGDIANIIGRLSRKPYITQEVIFGNGEPVTPAQYVSNGDVQEFRYTATLQSAFSSGNIADLQNLDNRGWVSGNQANVFVANHDTERNGQSLNKNSANNAYVLATIFSLAHPYGTPSILSSYDGFTNVDAGAPNGNAGTCSETGGTNGWLCQHRWIAFSGMVSFRNAVGTAAMNNWQTNGNGRIAFGRGSSGFVAINTAGDAWSTTFSSSMAAGTYCDAITGKSSSGKCTGAAVTVASGGKITVTVAARSAIAIYSGSTGTPGTPAPGGASIIFRETATTALGQNIFVTGSVGELGNWAPGSSIALSSASYPVWTATIDLPASTRIEYKFIRKEADGVTVTWESSGNRVVTTPSSGSQTVDSSWQ